MSSLRIVFMGTSEFAVESLSKLVENGHNVVGVVTVEDKFGGRGMKTLIESPVKKYASQKGIKVLQPKNLKSKKFLIELQFLCGDVFFVVAFRMLPEVVFEMPRFGTFNLHASLLPAYRGAAPINHALINGEKITGVTTFKLQKAIDTGDIALQRKVDILDTDDASTLHDKLMIAGAEILLETLKKIEDKSLTLKAQDDSKYSSAPKIFHELCKIDWTQPGDIIINLIRGLSPYPGAWTSLDGKELKIYKADLIQSHESKEVGSISILGKNRFGIYCKDCIVEILDLQIEGKKRMNAVSFVNGYKFMDQKVNQINPG